MKETFGESVKEIKSRIEESNVMMANVVRLEHEAYYLLAKAVHEEVGDEEITFDEDSCPAVVWDNSAFDIIAVKSVYDKDINLYVLKIMDEINEDNWYNPFGNIHCEIDINELTDYIREYLENRD